MNFFYLKTMLVNTAFTSVLFTVFCLAGTANSETCKYSKNYYIIFLLVFFIIKKRYIVQCPLIDFSESLIFFLKELYS